jgi:hypothetical protein
MTKPLLDAWSAAGVRSTLIQDQDYRTPIIRTYQDVTPIIEANKRDQLRYEPGFQNNPMRLRRVASLPFVVMQHLVRIGIAEMGKDGYRIRDHKEFLRFLSDPDNRALRTDDGGRLA